MKSRNLEEILDEISDFERTKNDILDNIFLVSLLMNTRQCSVYTIYISLQQTPHTVWKMAEKQPVQMSYINCCV